MKKGIILNQVARLSGIKNIFGSLGFFCFILSVFPALADDALVLPRHAWRFYLVPAWTTVTANFDNESRRQPIAARSGRIESFNLGYAIEYGISKWLNAGIQWSPGTTFSSGLDFPSGDPQRRDLAHLNDAFDAKAGFKLQVLGSKVNDPQRATGMFQSSTWRLAAAFGIKFPLTAIDWDRQAANLFQGRPYLAQASDRHLLAPIMSLHADRVIVRDSKRELFINLYFQYTAYLSGGKYGKTSLARHLDPGLADSMIRYGYDFLFEVDPHLDNWIVARTLRIGCYLPVRFKTAPASKLDGAEQHNESYSVTFFPTLDLFWLLAKSPIEIKIGYLYNLAGKNSPQANSLAIILRVIVL